MTIEPPSSVSAVFTVQDLPDDDTLPGPYDPSEGETVFAMWFDLRPVVELFSKCSFSDIYMGRSLKRALADKASVDPCNFGPCSTVSSKCNDWFFPAV